MTERRIADRQRIDETASIAVDEHSSIACLIYDVSRDGVRLVAPDLHAVPATFVLSGRRFAETQICEVVWRSGEEIGARFRTPSGPASLREAAPGSRRTMTPHGDLEHSPAQWMPVRRKSVRQDKD